MRKSDSGHLAGPPPGRGSGIVKNPKCGSDKARWQKNLERDPRVTCMVEAGTEYVQLRGVVIQGTAEPVDSRDEVARISAPGPGSCIASNGVY